MQNYGLDGRQVAVYTDKPNGKVRLYLYNGVLHQLEPISGVEAEWGDIGGDQSDVNISGFTNDSGFTTNEARLLLFQEVQANRKCNIIRLNS